MIHKLIVSKLITDNDIKKLKGTWIDEEYIKYPIINTDTDIYYINENNEENTSTIINRKRKRAQTSEKVAVSTRKSRSVKKKIKISNKFN